MKIYPILWNQVMLYAHRRGYRKIPPWITEKFHDKLYATKGRDSLNAAKMLGITIDGDYRKVLVPSGLYVVGHGELRPVENDAEADRWLERVKNGSTLFEYGSS